MREVNFAIFQKSEHGLYTRTQTVQLKRCIHWIYKMVPLSVKNTLDKQTVVFVLAAESR